MSGSFVRTHICKLSSRHLILALVVIVGLGASLDKVAATTVASGSFDGTSPTMNGRLNRNGLAGTCSALKTVPADTSLAGIQYNVVSYVHTGPSRCVTFSVATNTCGIQAFLSIYNGSFNPASRLTNYLADPGISGPGTKTSVNLIAGQTLQLVVSTVAAGQNCSYSIDSDEPTHDFDGGGKSDILWRSSAGDISQWLMNGVSATAVNNLGNIPINWSIVAQRDFNGDGKADILWRSSAGDISMWLMNGATATTIRSLGNIGTTWSVVSTADVDGDGRGDILWRDTSGNIALWTWSNNNDFAVVSRSLGNIPLAWSVVATADFNADGKADILWRDTSGNLAMWQISISGATATVSSVTSLGNVPTNWMIAGTADFNSDGRGDILWRSDTGDTVMWLMNGTSATVSSLGNIAANWSVVSNGDYNGDGYDDILWRSASGDLAMWLMNGASISLIVGLGNIPTNWAVQNANAD